MAKLIPVFFDADKEALLVFSRFISCMLLQGVLHDGKLT